MHSIAARWTRKTQILGKAYSVYNGRIINYSIFPLKNHTSLVVVPHYNFSLYFGRNRSKERTIWKDFGSHEEEINSHFNVEHNPPIHRDSRRCGAIGYKMGMTTLWDKWGIANPCTIIQIDRCQVIQIKENVNGKLKHKIQVGAGEGNIKTIKKPQLGHFLKIGLPIKKHLAEFDVTRENFLPIGYMIGPSYFKVGNYVDAIGTSKGKGFQGTIKRWNFKHQSFTHGNSKAHRKPGALQGCEFPGKVFKGKKMAAQMGNASATQFSCKVLRVDTPRSLLYLKGSVPGAIGGMIKIRDSLKKMDKQKRGVNDIRTGIDTYEGDEQDPLEVYEHEN